MICFLRMTEQSKPTLFRAQSVFEAVPKPFGFIIQLSLTFLTTKLSTKCQFNKIVSTDITIVGMNCEIISTRFTQFNGTVICYK